MARLPGDHAGDFNADGRVDVAGIDANNDMRLYLGSGAAGNYLAGSQTNYDGLAKRQGFAFAPVVLDIAIGRYGADPVRLQQIVWPDPEGRFPWQDGCGHDAAA